MGKSNGTVCFAKCFILFMALLILLQGCVYLGLSIWGIVLEGCNEQVTDVTAEPFKFIMDLVYFANKKCGAPEISIPDLITIPPGIPEISTPSGDETYVIGMDWAKSEIVTNRMNIFLIVYAVVSGIWIITSLMVLVTICGPVTKIVSAICFWPWFLIIIGGSILDAVATGYHVHDILHTTSAEDTFEYVGATVSSEVLSVLKNFDAYFMTPAVVMTIITSRVVLIWLLNIIGSIFCLSLSRVLAQNNAENKNINDRRAELPPPGKLPTPRQVQALQTQPELTRQQTQYNEPYPQQIRPKPLPIQTLPVSEYQNREQRAAETPRASAPVVTPVYVPSAPSPDSSDNNLRRNEITKEPSTYNDITTYRSTDTHPDRLDYPPQANSDAGSLASEMLATSPLNNRYAGSDGFSFQNQPQRVSAELRSQLPWSYTNILKPPPPPRKPQVQIYPEIPEADYNSENNAGPQSSNASNAIQQQQQQQQNQAYSRW